MAWKSAEFGEKGGIVEGIHKASPALRLNAERCFIDTLDLTFYPKSRLLKLTGDGVPHPPLWYVQLPQAVVPMDGSFTSISNCNAAAPLVLNDATVYAYVKFRYFFAGETRVFEASIKRSPVGYTGKIWLYQKKTFYEMDVNISARGVVTELEKNTVPDVPDFEADEFGL